MKVLSRLIFRRVRLACSGSKADVGPVTEVVLASGEVGARGMEFTCPLHASLDVGTLLGNSSFGHCTGGHLFPGVGLHLLLLAEEVHVSKPGIKALEEGFFQR